MLPFHPPPLILSGFSVLLFPCKASLQGRQQRLRSNWAERCLLAPRPPGAYLGLGDGAVQGVVLLVVEQAEVQRAQGGCGQGGLRSPQGHTGEKRHPALCSQTRCHGVHADCHRLGTCYLSSPPPWEGAQGG